jgi:hypothetical protein
MAILEGMKHSLQPVAFILAKGRVRPRTAR